MLAVKRKATGSAGYIVMFTTVLILAIVTVYMAQVAKLMTHQHHIDDSLADSVLASLVADDIYYFETLEMTGTPVVRFRSITEAHNNFVSSMNAAISEMDDFYYNFHYDEYIGYEVEGGYVTITKYTGDAVVKSVTRGRVGQIRTPKGKVVTESSAYGRVRFDIKNIIDGSYTTRSKDIYCTFEINS